MKKAFIVEAVVIVILFIVLLNMPSHRKLSSINEKSLTFEHTGIKAEAIAENPVSDGDEKVASIDATRAKAGAAAYEKGISTDVVDTTPVPKQDPIGGLDDNPTGEPTESADPTEKPEPTKKAETTKKAEVTEKAETTKKAEVTEKAEVTKKAETTKKAEVTEKAETTKKAEDSKKDTPTPTPKLSGKTCVVTASSLRLRSRPDYSDDHNAVFLAMNGEVLQVVTTDVPTDDKIVTEWVEVYYKERYLYVPLQYVEMQ